MIAANPDIGKRDDVRKSPASSTRTTPAERRTQRSLDATLQPTVYCRPADVDDCVKKSQSR